MCTRIPYRQSIDFDGDYLKLEFVECEASVERHR